MYIDLHLGICVKECLSDLCTYLHGLKGIVFPGTSCQDLNSKIVIGIFLSDLFDYSLFKDFKTFIVKDDGRTESRNTKYCL